MREYSANMILRSAPEFDLHLESTKLYAEDSVIIIYEVKD